MIYLLVTTAGLLIPLNFQAFDVCFSHDLMRIFLIESAKVETVICLMTGDKKLIFHS